MMPPPTSSRVPATWTPRTVVLAPGLAPVDDVLYSFRGRLLAAGTWRLSLRAGQAR